ncbi:MAG: NADH:ubiquinone reductase (Na(+)-transporting) subunit B [Bacteroidales bacterium]|jgi:Na+-transporting NADH:ubiquinone oxidoreductase subunit B|nr:NADH:ubiquinone reductase (Na(+)-transporting) subunit B [Bacteroidales bacterium]
MLRKFFDRIKPKLEKGKSLHFLKSTVEAFESFAFVPDKVTKMGSHVRDSIDSKRAMSIVMVALLPAMLFGMWNVGYQHFLSYGGLNQGIWDNFWWGFLKVLPIIAVTYVVGLGIEFTVVQWRGEEVNEGFLVTGMLIPMLCPPNIPLWIVAVATAFAVIIGKEIFGGTGMNIWNPALLARAFMFFSYPSTMSGDTVWIADKADAFSGATPLAQVINGSELPPISDLLIGNIPGSIGETSKIAILIGAIILLWSGVASFKVMFSVFAGGISVATVLHYFGHILPIDPFTFVMMGGFAFGAVFMATDPVTSSQTNAGKWIFGFLVGALAVVIRCFNPAYPEGMMMAILLMNTFVPLIDYGIVQNNKRKRKNRTRVK